MTIYTAVQPTGELHLGNYLGAILPFIKMANERSDVPSFMAIADIHATTLPYKAKELKASCLSMARMLIACGLTDNTVLYRQSALPGHFMLSKIIEHMSTMGDLGRMTQFKSKGGEDSESIPLGLFTYPCLMASDIMLFGSHYVPVGDDQTQHLEFACKMIRKFNKKMKPDIDFRIPQAIKVEGASRIMSLSDPLKKMSKSDPVQTGVIYLTDDRMTVERKIKKAKSGSGYIPDTLENLDDIEYRAMDNLFNLLSFFSGESVQELIKVFADCGNMALKDALSTSINQHLDPIRQKASALSDHDVEEILKEGANKALERSTPYLNRAMSAAGF